MNEQHQSIIKFIQESGNKGVSMTHIIDNFPQLTKEKVLKLVNDCLNMKEDSGLVPFYDSKNEAWFKCNPQLRDASKLALKSLDEQHLIVYRIIQNAHRDGIWTKLIKQRAGAAATRTFNKVLKTLEQKKLIKSFKSITMKSKRLYILYDLEPAEYHVGDIWYNDDGEFDESFVKVVLQTVSNHMRTVNYASLESVRAYLASTNIILQSAQLRESHIKTIMNTLIYEGFVESFTTPQGETNYKMTRQTIPVNGLTLTPCGICPVKHHCGKTSQVTPEKCIYLTQWIDF
jgi:DNA-directed RNA polymerase III subunit RPC6